MTTSRTNGGRDERKATRWMEEVEIQSVDDDRRPCACPCSADRSQSWTCPAAHCCTVAALLWVVIDRRSRSRSRSRLRLQSVSAAAVTYACRLPVRIKGARVPLPPFPVPNCRLSAADRPRTVFLVVSVGSFVAIACTHAAMPLHEHKI